MQENRVKSFTFYEDYYNLIDTIPEKDKKELLCIIVDYVFKDIEPTNLNGHNKAIFNTLKAQLNKSKNQSKRRTGNKPNEYPEENQKETKKEPRENKTSVLSFKFIISNFKFIEDNDLLKNKILEWSKYKSEKKKGYTETGFKTLLKQIEKNCREYGINAVVNLIDECMASNYQGIIFDKLKEQKSKKNIIETPKWFNQKIEEERNLTEEDERIIRELKEGD